MKIILLLPLRDGIIIRGTGWFFPRQTSRWNDLSGYKMDTASIREFLNRKIRKNVFIQIGTNNGEDFFRDMVLLHKPQTVILIEPNKDLMGFIEKNYYGINGVHIETVAITKIEEDDVILYIPRQNESGFADNGQRNYDYGHLSLLPMNDWGDKETMRTIHAKGVTLNSIFDKYGITYVDFLCIDTEGYDGEIIKTIDFLQHLIDIIKYEDWSFPSENFSKHNTNWEELGLASVNVINDILFSFGYDIYNDAEDIHNKFAITQRDGTWMIN